MRAMQLGVLVVLSVAMFACSKEKAGGEETGAKAAAAGDQPAAAEVSCDAVVAKLAGFNPGSGEPEKKLWGKMCAEMSPKARACTVAAASLEESQKCLADKKLE